MLPLILLPAMPCDERLYRAQVDDLSDIVEPRVKVLAEESFAASAELLLSQVQGRFIVAGTAYGGCLAIEIAARAPDRVAGLWLMNCNPGVHPDPAGVRATSARIRNGEHAAVTQEFAAKAIPPSDIISRATFVQMARDSGVELFARQSDATLTRRDHWDTLATVKVPTLLIWGAADTFVPIEVGRRLADVLPDARFEEFPGCGHFPSMERPEMTTAIAREWLFD
ncbi:alpha/beta fold hydrolase, partial [Cupriavidus basilensis]|uniref:alpha/beta fold hydrolase n=1 Tax=Cupriavidus basilensis TaxID=68895 RepID=UPI00157A94E8